MSPRGEGVQYHNCRTQTEIQYYDASCPWGYVRIALALACPLDTGSSPSNCLCIVACFLRLSLGCLSSFFQTCYQKILTFLDLPAHLSRWSSLRACHQTRGASSCGCIMSRRCSQQRLPKPLVVACQLSAVSWPARSQQNLAAARRS